DINITLLRVEERPSLVQVLSFSRPVLWQGRLQPKIALIEYCSVAYGTVTFWRSRGDISAYDTRVPGGGSSRRSTCSKNCSIAARLSVMKTFITDMSPE